MILHPKQNQFLRPVLFLGPVQLYLIHRRELLDIAFGPVPPPKMRQTDLNSHLVVTSVFTKEDIDETVAEFIFGCNLSFQVVESPLFKKMVGTLHPGYKPPTRALSAKLLDKVHHKHQAHMKAKLDGQTVTMQQNGWSTVQNGHTRQQKTRNMEKMHRQLEVEDTNLVNIWMFIRCLQPSWSGFDTYICYETCYRSEQILQKSSSTIIMAERPVRGNSALAPK